MPATNLNHKTEQSKAIRCLSDDELSQLIVGTDRTNIRLAIVLMGDAGLRIGEMLKLRWQHLWFAEEPVGAIELSSDMTKNRRPRTIPVTMRLHDAARQEIVNVNVLAPDFYKQFVFLNPANGKPYTSRWIQRHILSIGAKTLHKRVTPHMLRHTFATRLMRKCSTRVVQNLLGHSSLTSTQVYTHPNHVDMQTAVDSLNESTQL